MRFSFLTVVLLWGVSASATVMPRYSLESLAGQADVAVEADVLSTDVRLVRTETSLVPHTFVTLRVRDVIAGTPTDEIITIEEFGGEWKGGGAGIAGAPQYKKGEHVVVFLKRRSIAQKRYFTYGLAQGKFRIDPSNQRIVRNLRDMVLLPDTSAARTGTLAPERLSLEALKQRIRAAGVQ